MKKILIFFILLPALLHSQVIIKIVSNFVLINNEVGEINKIEKVYRHQKEVGKIKIIKYGNNKTAAIIIKQDKKNPIKAGDHLGKDILLPEKLFMIPGKNFASKKDSLLYSASLHFKSYSKYYYYGFMFQVVGFIISSVELNKNGKTSPIGPIMILSGALITLYAPGEISRAGSELMKAVEYK